MLFVPKNLFLVRTFSPDKYRQVSIKIYNNREEKQAAQRKTEYTVRRELNEYISK